MKDKNQVKPALFYEKVFLLPKYKLLYKYSLNLIDFSFSSQKI